MGHKKSWFLKGLEQKNKVFIDNATKEGERIKKRVKTNMDRKQKNMYAKALFVFSILISLTISQMQWAKAETPQITFIDVTVGDTKEESACIFEVNGKTVIVNRREKETVDGITIYVQEVYPVNTEEQKNDRCEFLYSIKEENNEEEDDKNNEEAVKKEVIGEKIINFLLGKRDIGEEKEKEAEESDEEEPNEETRVLVNGYDVTGAAVSETSKESTNEKTERASGKKGFLGRLFSWIFE